MLRMMRAGPAALMLSACFALPAAATDSLDSIAKKVSKAAAAAKIQRVAVLPFVSSNGHFPEDGLVLSERLVSALVERRRLHVVERELLASLMKEQSLAQTGIVGTEGRQAIGRILSVDAVVTGSFISFGRKVRANARLIRIESGDIVFAKTFELPIDWFDPEPSPGASLLGLADNDALSCRQAQLRLETLERSLIDLKTRYWTSQLDLINERQ